ncbi:MAG: tRNA (uridine(34)/cytosine(34)/5-carboxymethylaminomethyluridine (34)-2'-O)-methyltransferase TrmL [Gammaproteobacteria bacterium]
MLHLALYQPEIPPNTGNIIRLCANSGAQLHLIHPLGFTWDDKRLQRAGLDYHEFADIIHHTNFESFYQAHQHQRIFAYTTKASRYYTDVNYRDQDILLFGPETRGLPQEVFTLLGEEQCIKIPMRENSRSLNLSNAAAIGLYEALRQIR